MNISRFILPISVVFLAAQGAHSAQQPASARSPAADVQLLQKQMLEIQAALQQTQAQHQQEIDALKAQLAAQQKIIDDFRKTVADTSAPPLPSKPAEAAAAPGNPPRAAEGTALFPTTDALVARLAVALGENR